VEPDQIDVLPPAVLCNLKQIEDAKESRLERQRRGNIRKSDRFDGVHLDLAFFHTVPRTNFDVGAHPESDTASDLSATNSLAKAFRERHENTLTVFHDQRSLRRQ